ncbi:MAG: class I SAM-dependent methyltransferase [Pseudomonadota bacterium]
MFQTLREQPLRMLEIGVGGYNFPFCGGASLRMWAEYFPNARLVGLDIADKQLTLDPRISFVRGSQTDRTLLQRLWLAHGPFDIVIDDGSHIASDVLTSFQVLYPMMKPHGIYAVEDVQTAFWPGGFDGSADGSGTIVAAAQATALDMHRREIEAVGFPGPQPAFGDITAAVHLYRNLIFFQRGQNSASSSLAASRADDPGIDFALRMVRQERLTDPAAGGFLTEATLLNKIGELEAAIACIRHGIELYPTDVDLLFEAARLAVKAGDPAMCRGWFERIKALFPGDAAVESMLDEAAPS